MKREKELNNNGSSSSQRSETRTWSNYVMDLSSHSPSSPVAKNLRPFVFETCGSQGINSGSVSRNVSDTRPDTKEQQSTENHSRTEQTTDRLALQTDCPFPSSVNSQENQSESKSSTVVKDILSFTFPLDSTKARSHPCTLNLDLSRRSPFSYPAEMSTSKSLTQISEVTERETPSPLAAVPSGESKISTSFVQYQSKSTGSYKPLFPSGETSTVARDSSKMDVDQSYSSSAWFGTKQTCSGNVLTTPEMTTGENKFGFLRKSKSCMSHISDISASHGFPSGTNSSDSSVTTGVKHSPSFSLPKFGGRKPLRTSLSLSLSPIVPLKPSTTAVNSGDNNSSPVKPKNFPEGDRMGKQVKESSETHKSLNVDFKTSQSTNNIPGYCNKTTVTTSQKVALKSFSGAAPTCLTLSAHSPTTPTRSLAKLNFSMTDNEKVGKKYDTKVEKIVTENPAKSNEKDNLTTMSDKPVRFYSFPATSLDKLNFTPCFSKMSEKELKNDQNNVNTSPPRTSGVKRPLNNNIIDLQDEEAVSPMSVSSTASSSSGTNSSLSSPLTNGIPAKVAVRKRERKSNRPNVRPNSIAFSTYPTFDLGSDCQESPNSSSSTQSQDDSSEVYIQNGKKSKPSEYMSDIRFRLGRYCEREVYMQITAAMESAMMKSQSFDATRKSRSLDDILSSEDDSSSPNCECSTFDRVLRHCAMTRDRYSAPAMLFESLACRGSSDPYNSNSSLSSGGSRSSLHGSMELIQVL